MKKNQLFLLAIAFIFLFSCRNNNNIITNSQYSNGAFVIEQGNFMNGTGTLSFLNKTNNEFTKDIFGTKNGFAIGNVLQSMNIFDNVGYLVVNNANKIVTFDPSNMAYQSTINGLQLPRYIKQINSQKAYISEWGSGVSDGAIQVYDLNTKSIVKRIVVGNGAEQILVYGDRAYVTCNGGLGNSDSMAIININTDVVIGKLAIGANPESMVQDADNNIWVLCKGAWNSTFTALTKTGSLVRYNTFTNTIDRNFPMTDLYSQPVGLCMNAAKTRLYYAYNGGMWFFDKTSSALQPVQFVWGQFYNIAVDPSTDIIYTADVKDYVSNGLVRRYDIYGGKIDSFSVGIMPSDFYFTHH